MHYNFVPLPYRRVSVQPYSGPWHDEEAIKRHLLGRDSYRRTDYIILHDNLHCAVVAIQKADPSLLFSKILSVQIVSTVDQSVWVEDEEIDTGNPSDLARKAKEIGLPRSNTLVVRGRYGHTNFIYKPSPLVVKVADVLPPSSPRIFEMAQLVLKYSNLPPIELQLHPINMDELIQQDLKNTPLLIPCRASGMGQDRPVFFLDEHPEFNNWTLIGCERSCQIHRHFYGVEPQRIEVCPRKLVQKSYQATLVKCCMLEEHIEISENYVVVPWGSDVGHIESAIKALAEYAINHGVGGEKDVSLG